MWGGEPPSWELPPTLSKEKGRSPTLGHLPLLPTAGPWDRQGRGVCPGTRDIQGEHGKVGREKSAWLETWGEMVQGSGLEPGLSFHFLS